MFDGNDAARASEIVRGLLEDSRFGFHDKGGYLRGGICPDCGKKELYVLKAQPWRIACSRENKCGSSWAAKELLPHLFENYLKRHPPTSENPKATADAYMMEDRGFLPSKCRTWYEQEGHRLKDTGEFVPTIRFYLDPERTRYWERLIGKTKADGQKAHIGGARKADGSMYRGDAWTPPGQILESGEHCFITEGIFHAIALIHAGKKVAAAIGSSNFPANLIEANKGKGVIWVLAMDGDRAGRKYMAKHRNAIVELGETVEVCLLPDGRQDWDDLWQAGRLNDAFFEECFYQGRLFSADNVLERVWQVFCRYPTRRHHIVEFENAIYSAEVDSKFSSELRGEDVPMDSPEAKNRFHLAVTIDMICNVAPRFLYMEKDDLMDEQKYVFQIDYKNGTPTKIISIDGSSLTGGEVFNKALLNNTNGGRYSGDNRSFAILTKRWLDRRMLEVQSIPFIGYEKKSKAWVFHDNAFQTGRKVKLNEHGYFELGRQGIKTSLGSFALNTDGEFDTGWLPDYVRAFHFQGLTVLAFWLGTLFAQQIREAHKTFPFLEFTGEPGSGKSTVLEFCWKLVGRDEYEGFDIAKSSQAGRRRAFNQVSNLPIVIIESDRDRGDNEKKPMQFDFDECKPFYNGRSTGTLGVATRSNDVDEQLFQASLLISQNAEVDGSEALLQRIVHCHVDKKHHGAGTREIARWFERQTSATVGGFLELALKNEKPILGAYFKAFTEMEKFFADGQIKNERIIKNHAQIAACAHALQVIFPNLTRDMLHDLITYLGNRALIREERIAADHPMVEKFWETFHYINSEKNEVTSLDFSNDAGFIAVNLNHFRAQCVAHGQEVMDLTLLKKILPQSKRHKFIESNRSIRVKLVGKIVRCWIFKK
jgi:hypothetical protein